MVFYVINYISLGTFTIIKKILIWPTIPRPAHDLLKRAEIAHAVVSKIMKFFLLKSLWNWNLVIYSDIANCKYEKKIDVEHKLLDFFKKTNFCQFYETIIGNKNFLFDQGKCLKVVQFFHLYRRYFKEKK